MLLIGRVEWEIGFNQSEALPRSGYYGISALVSQTSFGGETSGSVAKCRLFSQAEWGFTYKSSLSHSAVPWPPNFALAAI